MSKRTVHLPRPAADPVKDEVKYLAQIRTLQSEIQQAVRSPACIADVSAWVRDKEAALVALLHQIEERGGQLSSSVQLVVDCKLLRRQVREMKESLGEDRRCRTPIETASYRAESPFSLSMAKRRLREVVVRRQEEVLTGALTDIVPTKERTVPRMPTDPMEISRKATQLHDSDELFSTFTDPGKSASSNFALNTDRTAISRSGLQTERRYEPEDEVRSSNSSRQSDYFEGKKWRREWEREAEVNALLRERLLSAQKEASKVSEMAREMDRIQEDKMRLEADLVRLKEKSRQKKETWKRGNSALKSENLRLEQLMKSLELDKSGLQLALDAFKAEKTQWTEEIQRYIRELAYTKDVMSGLERQVAETKTQDDRIKHLEEALREQDEDQAYAEDGRVRALEEALDRERARSEDLERQIDQGNQGKREVEEDHLGLMESQIEGIQAELRSLLEHNATLQDREVRLSHDLKASERDRQVLQASLATAQHRISELERELVATEHAVQSIIDLQRKETQELRVEEGKAKTVSHRLQVDVTQMLEGIQLMIRTKRTGGPAYC